MKIQEMNNQLGGDYLDLETQEDDTVTIESNGITTVIKHNDIGISIDYYRKGEDQPFREDQVWWND